MKRAALVGLGAAIALGVAGGDASAFCGFYVGGADAKLFNNATQVVMMREGTRTVLAMQNDYQGPPEGFALVVPVPVVLQKENVKTLPKEVFDRVDKLTSPRLVEYWEQDPCPPAPPPGVLYDMAPTAGAPARIMVQSNEIQLGVTVLAKFSVGEYDIVILSAKDSGGLDTWLRQNKYKIPEGAAPYLEPYVKGGSKFFVAKVDPKKVTMVDGHAALSPLRFHYDTTEFSLPVRLGLINSKGTQDLIVNILAQNQRFEPANYPSVTIPTNLDVGEDAKTTFGGFYTALFDEMIKKNPKAIVTEYSWDASTCDPCPGPALNPEDFATLGADVVPNGAPPQATVRMAPDTKSNAMNIGSQLQYRAQTCWQQSLQKKPKGKGGRIELKVGKSAAIAKNDTGDAELATCVQRVADGIVATAPQASDVVVPLLFASSSPPRLYGWTITRLHARYTKDALGQDIVFKAAKPITGGREVRTNGKDLEHGSTEASMNNFQGRYAIRHPWTGPIACANPIRGVWGGPPNGGGSMPIAAEKVAFAPRGAPLTSFLRSDVPELGITGVAKPLADAVPVASAPPAPPPVDAGPAAPPPTPQPSGCGCTVPGGANASAAGLILALAGLVVARLRRRA
jgi:hypothetical protein